MVVCFVFQPVSSSKELEEIAMITAKIEYGVKISFDVFKNATISLNEKSFIPSRSWIRRYEEDELREDSLASISSSLKTKIISSTDKKEAVISASPQITIESDEFFSRLFNLVNTETIQSLKLSFSNRISVADLNLPKAVKEYVHMFNPITKNSPSCLEFDFTRNRNTKAIEGLLLIVREAYVKSVDQKVNKTSYRYK